MRLKTRRLLVTLAALLVLSGGCAPAGTWHWQRAEAGLPRQAVVLALAVDQEDANRLWAGYYAPGGLAASRDGGGTWSADAEGLGDNPVFDLLWLEDGVLLAAARDGLYMRENGGHPWQPLPGNLPQAAAFALAADASGRTYAGMDGAGLYAHSSGEDGWAPLARGKPGTPAGDLSTAAILSLAVSTDGQQIYVSSAGDGLFASRDGGRTWTAALPGHYAPNVAMHPARPAFSIASLRDRLVRTRDGGESWEPLDIAWTSQEVVSLLWSEDGAAPGAAAQATDAGTLWAGTGEGRLYCSLDGGDAWLEMKPLPAQGGLLELARAGDRLLAGAWTGVYALPARCQRDGPDWTYLSPSLGLPYAKTLLSADAGLLLGARSGLYEWQPAEERWAGVALAPSEAGGSAPGDVTVLAAAPSDARVIYAGTAAGGLYRSGDGGDRWSRVPSDLEVGVRALAVSPENALHVYMVAAWERVYASRDGGGSWQARWTGLGHATEAMSLAVDPQHPSIIYLGSEGNLYRSLFGGEDWRPVGRPLDGQTVLALRALPEAEGRGQAPGETAAAAVLEGGAEASVLYIGATRGAYRSFDGGLTLAAWGEGLEGVSVTDFLFDPGNRQVVYAGTAYAGVYRSADGGKTWQPLNVPPELAGDIVEALAWGPAGELVAAAAGGVWMRTVRP
jgi:photosystem II stability/assembly factor-like uncharacterized protein